ncbi:MAG: hypothetical protein K6D93_09140, partial [Saccharofermentans sp.]|nr:hypothetical protein [Saccharofermentans sp.]MCR5288093.1 hypothetical protein [Saccharofermentans sp.]
ELGLELNEDNMGNIKELIDKCIEDPSFKDGRDKARSETWVHIGEGAVRSVDFVLKKYDEVVKKASEEKAVSEKGKAKSKKPVSKRKESKKSEKK